jgi:hypothetical protein
MALDNYLNPFFNKFDYQPTQDLYQDLIVQSIKIYGHEIFYIPRNITNFDKIYETDDQSNYSTPIQCPVYIENVDGFSGQKDIFTKFGLEIRDQITLTMARRTFERVIQPITNQPRPMEGDLIYFTLNKKVFQIKFTNNKEIFYPLGILPTFQMTLELFEYSDETFNTGIPEIDSIQKVYSLNVFDYIYTNESGNILTDENGNRITNENYDLQDIDPITDEDSLQTDANQVINNNEFNAFGFI